MGLQLSKPAAPELLAAAVSGQGGPDTPAAFPGRELTYRSPHLCCSHTGGNPFPPPCLWRFSEAGQQKTGGLHIGWGPGRKRGEGRTGVKITRRAPVGGRHLQRARGQHIQHLALGILPEPGARSFLFHMCLIPTASRCEETCSWITVEREFPHGLPSRLRAALMTGLPGWSRTRKCVCAGDQSLGGRAHAGLLRRWETLHTHGNRRTRGKKRLCVPDGNRRTRGKSLSMPGALQAPTPGGPSSSFQAPGQALSGRRAASALPAAKVASRQLPIAPSPSSCAQADTPGTPH